MASSLLFVLATAIDSDKINETNKRDERIRKKKKENGSDIIIQRGQRYTTKQTKQKKKDGGKDVCCIEPSREWALKTFVTYY